MCNNAQKFFRHGVALKQVANFYNTMDKELIQSHLAILLEPAKQFESVINANKKKAVTWNKTDEAEKYAPLVDCWGGGYPTRCPRGACPGVVAWTVSAHFEATCCWCLCVCPTLYLALQKDFGQCSHVQNWGWCAVVCHLSAWCCTGCT